MERERERARERASERERARAREREREIAHPKPATHRAHDTPGLRCKAPPGGPNAGVRGDRVSIEEQTVLALPSRRTVGPAPRPVHLSTKRGTETGT